MRSHPAPWATNEDYSGDPGVPTKMPPSAEQQADGYVTSLVVAPQIWNEWRWQMFRAMRDAHSIRSLNWFQGVTSALSGLSAYVVGPAGYDGFLDMHTVMIGPQPVSTPPNEAISYGGMIWAPSGLTGALPTSSVYDFEADQGGQRAITLSGNDQVWRSSIQTSGGGYAPTNWSLWPGFPGTPAQYWRVANSWDYSGSPFGPKYLWVFFDLNALAYYATTPSNPIAPALSDPGFITAIPRDVIHSHHYSGLLWPDDLGNPKWIAITPTEISTSDNGQNWVSAYTHSMPNPLAVGYSAVGTKWICPQGRAVATPGVGADIYYSIDNGLSWVLAAGVVPATITITVARIDCDLFGNWVLAVGNGTNIQYFISFDNGESWQRIYTTVNAYPNFFRAWYGGGRFNLVSSPDPAGGLYNFFHSLRGGE